MTVSSRASLASLVGDLGVRIGHREDGGVVGHRPDHLLVDDAADGEADEHVGAFHGVGQVATGDVAGELGLELVEALVFDPVGGDDPAGVTHDDVVLVDAEALVESGGRDGTGARAGEDDVEVREFLCRRCGRR